MPKNTLCPHPGRGQAWRPVSHRVPDNFLCWVGWKEDRSRGKDKATFGHPLPLWSNQCAVTWSQLGQSYPGRWPTCQTLLG